MSRQRSLAALGGAALVVLGLLFDASAGLDLAHVIVGVAAVLVGRPIAVALASLGLWLLGVAGAGAWLSLGTADNWLHLLVAVAMLGLAFLVRGEDLAEDLEGDLGGRLPAEV